jgi:hypothetical protein
LRWAIEDIDKVTAVLGNNRFFASKSAAILLSKINHVAVKIMFVLVFILLFSFAMLLSGNDYFRAIPLLTIWLIILSGLAWFFTLPYASLARYGGQITRKYGSPKHWDKRVLTIKGEYDKSEALRMKKYFLEYNVKSDRSVTELISYAIALGFGREWMQKIGKINAPVKSLMERFASEEDGLQRYVDLKEYVNSA